MRILFFIIPLLLTILICFFNGLYDGSYLLLPLFCNENIYNKIKSNKLFLLFPYIGEIIGSVFLGHLVLKKIQYHFIDILSLSHNQLFISVIIILSITVFIYLISSFLPFVVSLSHTIIGGLVGIGYFYNVKIYWENLVITTILWTITPVISLIVGYLVFNLIKIFVYKSTLSYKFAIFFSFLTFFFLATFILFIFYKISRIGFLIMLLIIFFILFI
ncbi:MAG: inorganic phosphate transporter, partial [Exilispira sp.]